MNVPAFPAPPSAAPAQLPTTTFDPRTPLFRIHASTHPAVFFNSSADYRFNAPAAEFGVLYAAAEMDGAFVETFCRTLNACPPLITLRQLETRSLSTLQLTAKLQLVDLTGAGLPALGIDNRIGTCDYAIAQRWAKWFWSHPSAPQGICYRSRHDPAQRYIALFSGRSDPMESPLAKPLTAPSFAPDLTRLTDKYQASVL